MKKKKKHSSKKYSGSRRKTKDKKKDSLEQDLQNDIKKDVKNDIKDDKKDDKKELSERQTIIVKILLENPSITIKELANRTGISTSTINREIEKINQLGVSISREGGKTYGKWIVKL